jgi:hypothetical protein
MREGDFEFEDEEDEVQTTLKKWVPNTYGISMGGSSARSGRSIKIAPVGLGVEVRVSKHFWVTPS